MTKSELNQKIEDLKLETNNALQTVVENLNNGQRNKLSKIPKIKELFDRYNVTLE